MLGPKAAAACREALIGGLEKILEKHHKRMLLDMQQWLDSLDDQTAWDEKTEQIAETGLSSLPCGSLPSGSLKQSRDSARSDQSLKEKLGGPERLTNLSAPQVSIMSRSRITSLDRSDYEQAHKVSVMHRERQSRLSMESAPSQVAVTSQAFRSTKLEACRPCCKLLARIISSGGFEAFFAVVIATNSLFIGITIEWEARERSFTLPSSLFLIQIIYTFLFLSEVCVKLVVFGARHFFCSVSWAWNWFDLAIVISAVFEVLVEIVAHDPQLSAGSSSNLRILRILRMTRLTRIFRVIRVVRFFRSLRTLVFSIVNTLKSLFWAMLLLALIMYVFGILFTDIANNYIIEGGAADATAKLQTYFGSLHVSVHTLFMSISGGLTWIDATMALSEISWIWVYVFSCYIAFSLFAVLNVMTGVFCQSAIKGAERDQEMVVQSLIMDKHQLKSSLATLFQKMDDDQSGKLTLAQFEKHFQDEEVRVLFEALEIGATDAWSLFLSLDHNEDYQIEPEEFLEGCLQLRGTAKAIDLFMLRRQVAKMLLHLSSPRSDIQASVSESL